MANKTLILKKKKMNQIQKKEMFDTLALVNVPENSSYLVGI